MSAIAEGLTGRMRCRLGFGKRFILQVEECFHVEDMHGESPTWKRWRDAKLEDFEALQDEKLL